MAKRLWTPGVMSIVVAMLVVACNAAATPTPAPTGTPGPTSQPTASMAPTASPPPAVPTVPTGYNELDKSLGTDQPYKGQKVTIQVQWTGGELANFQASLADYAKASGITIQVDSVPSSHETVLKSRIDGGSPPDIAQLAQPTPVLAYAAQGKVLDVATFMDATKLANEHPATIGLVSEGGHIWGIPYKADVKSTIWYPIAAFAAKGYQVPTTWDELIALSNQIVADGSNPWCISAGGPGDATGWQITDWVEEVVLKTKGLDYYNQWINHTVTFEDPGIKSAFDDYVGKIFFTDKYVFGGPQAIINTDQKTTMDPMFNPGNGDMSAPKCWMQKVPTWYGPDFFPDQRATNQPSAYVVGTDVGIFPFPTIDPNQNNAEGSADTMMVSAKPDAANLDAVKAVAEFLATPEGLENWIRAGSAISANTSTPSAWYEGAYKLKVAADIVNNAAGIGFDASDLMPGAVGAGSFWTQSVDWVNNNGTNTDAVLKAIDDSWPTQ
jgi:alpha-glucoside transport system substrate-binding protein